MAGIAGAAWCPFLMCMKCVLRRTLLYLLMIPVGCTLALSMITDNWTPERFRCAAWKRGIQPGRNPSGNPFTQRTREISHRSYVIDHRPVLPAIHRVFVLRLLKLKFHFCSVRCIENVVNISFHRTKLSFSPVDACFTGGLGQFQRQTGNTYSGW